MACSCMNKIRQSDRDIQSDLARKAAMLDGEIYALYRKPDGTYGFLMGLMGDNETETVTKNEEIHEQEEND